jgi:hypothetical protein
MRRTRNFAGGGEPGKAFLEYGKALMKKDFKAARKHLTGKFKGPDEQIQIRLEVDAETIPADVKITSYIKEICCEIHVMALWQEEEIRRRRDAERGRPDGAQRRRGG